MASDNSRLEKPKPLRASSKAAEPIVLLAGSGTYEMNRNKKYREKMMNETKKKKKKNKNEKNRERSERENQYWANQLFKAINHS